MIRNPRSGSSAVLADRRAQSESIGVILLAGVIVLSVGAFGTFYLPTLDDGGDRPLISVQGNVEPPYVNLTHAGGDPVDGDELRLVVTVDGERVDPGDPPGRFEPGETWSTEPDGVAPGSVIGVTLYHVPSGSRLYTEEWAADEQWDTTSPAVTVEAPDGGETLEVGTPFTVEWSESDDWSGIDDADIEYSTDGGDSWTTVASGVAGGTYDWTPESPTGAGQVRVTVADDAGNEATDTSNGTFTVESSEPDDTVAPVIDRISPNTSAPMDARNGEDVTVSWRTSDSGTGVANVTASIEDGSTTLDSQTVPAANGSVDLTVPDSAAGGNYSVGITAVDRAGNEESDTEADAVVVDGTEPTVSVDTPNASAPTYVQSGQDVTVSWSALDTGTGIESVTVSIENDSGTVAEEPVAPGSGPTTLTVREGAAEGEYDVVVEATDAAGNTRTVSRDNTVVVDDTAPKLTLEVEDLGNRPFFITRWRENYNVDWGTTHEEPYRTNLTVYRGGEMLELFTDNSGDVTQEFGRSIWRGTQYRFVLNATDRAGNSREIVINDTSNGSGSYSKQKPETGGGSPGNGEKGLSDLSVSDLDANEGGQQQTVSFTVDGGLAAGETVTIDLSDAQAAKGNGNGNVNQVNYHDATVSGNDDAQFTTQGGDNAVIEFTPSSEVPDGERISFTISGIETAKYSAQYSVDFDRSDTAETSTTTFAVRTSGGNLDGQSGDVYVEGDATLDEEGEFDGNIDATGSVSLGEETFVTGNIVADGDVNVGEESTVGGSVTSDGVVTVREEASVGDVFVDSADDIQCGEGGEEEEDGEGGEIGGMGCSEYVDENY